MGKVQRFERRLQGMVGDAFARVFGGSVVPQEVAQALQREADDNARPLAGGRVLAPNRYTVTLGASDHDRLAGDEQRVIRMLKGCIQSHLAEQAWDVYGDVVVALKRSETLHTGQFRTSSSVDPDTPQPRTAGDRAMSQQQGEHAGDAQGGQYRHDVASGAAPDYGQPSGHDFPGSRYVHEPSSPYAQDQSRQYSYDQGGGYQPGYQHYDENYEQTYGQYGYEQGDDRQLSASLTLDDGSNRCYQLIVGSTVVGRGQDAQFRLPDTGVSRRHLEITWDGQTATLADLGSTNGTTVNGTPVQTWQLVDGDVVRVGQSRLVFRTQG
ncbi:MAG: FHA domain-containing protein [Pseudonocardiales bacterium]|nr:FHA domain-containing protein [Pseudonocardiales bacterium]MBV9730392.1 FHA domain-containing protein [Pseudonocardiales bacterium]